MSTSKRFLGRIIFVVLLCLGFINPAGAATFEVTTTADTVDFNPGDGVCEDAEGSGVCSLRAAIMEANALNGNDVIILPEGTYTLAITSTYEDAAIDGDLDIVTDPIAAESTGLLMVRQPSLNLNGLVIQGAGAGTIIDGGGIDRVFHIHPNSYGSTVTINDLTITNGYREEADYNLGRTLVLYEDVSGLSGGGIYNAATTSVNSCMIQYNDTDRSGGGIFNNGEFADLTLTDCVVSYNNAYENPSWVPSDPATGVVVGQPITTDDVPPITANCDEGKGGTGGGIKNTGGATLTLIDTEINYNTAERSGGGISNTIAITKGSDYIPVLTELSMSGCTVSYNTADRSGGGIINSAHRDTDPCSDDLPLSDKPCEGKDLSLSDKPCEGKEPALIEASPLVVEPVITARLSMTGCTVSDNTADRSGGGVFNKIDGADGYTFAELSMTGCFVNVNKAEGGGGGGISNDGTSLTLIDTEINDNTAYSSGGGIKNTGSGSSLTGCFVNGNEAEVRSGGGISNDGTSLTLIDTEINGNTANRSGGGIKNTGSDSSLTGCFVNGNEAEGESGGGISNGGLNLTLTNTTINNNTAETSGGGIKNRGSDLNLTNCTVGNNTATSSSGGGIKNTGPGSTIIKCTINNNSAAANGGGISNSGVLTLTNSTVSTNHADGCTGGVHTQGDADTTFTYCTIANNTTNSNFTPLASSATVQAAGVNSPGCEFNTGTVTLQNTIIADNVNLNIPIPTDPSITAVPVADIAHDCWGVFVTLGLNMIKTPHADSLFNGDAIIDDDDGSAVVGTVQGDPDLEPLANNGGGTFTHALPGGSPALDRIECAVALRLNGTIIVDDQRFVPRPQSTIASMKCDIGAFEAFDDSVEDSYDDGDGVGAPVEIPAPNHGDGNGDFIFDCFQSGVTSLPGSDGNYVTVEIIDGPVGCGQLSNVITFSEASQGDDPDYDYPYGLVAFEINCEWARVRVYFHGATEPLTGPYRKYGPVPPYTPGVDPVWYDLNATFGMVVIDGEDVFYAEFDLTDGALGDDTVAEGVIFDQGGPAVPDAVIPTLNEWGMIILSILIVITGMYYRRKEVC